jgi:hypothetical protein
MNKLQIIAFALVSCGVCSSCEDDVVPEKNSVSVVKTVVQFESAGTYISENAQTKSIVIGFSKPLEKDAIINVGVDTDVTKYFTTSPAVSGTAIVIAAKKGSSSASFAFAPINNSTNDGNKSVRFTIVSADPSIVPGQRQLIYLTIEDDDGFGKIEFIDSDTVLSENTDQWNDINLRILSSNEAEGTAVVEAISQTAVYGVDYITEPAFANNRLTLTASAGNADLKFKVKALNDNQISGHAMINFIIRETTGNLNKGSAFQQAVTIADDELSG